MGEGILQNAKIHNNLQFNRILDLWDTKCFKSAILKFLPTKIPKKNIAVKESNNHCCIRAIAPR